MVDGKLVWLQEEVRNGDISIPLTIWEQSSISVLFKGHSGSNLIDPTRQDNVVIGTGIFPYIYHVRSTFNLYSIINNGLVKRIMTQHQDRKDDLRRAAVLTLADPRVVIVRVILVGVLGVMIVVLIGHGEVRVNVEKFT